MKFLTVFIKEIAELVIRNLRKRSVQRDNSVKEILENLKADGIFVEDGFYSREKCNKLIKKIDNLIESGVENVWLDDDFSDHRLYFANELDEDFDEFYKNEKIRCVLSNYTGTTAPNGMVLAARIEYKNQNMGSGGGWHRDSPFTHQFKAICYLNDVDENNGPFEYIKKSHLKKNILFAYLKRFLKPGQYRFNDDEIPPLLSSQELSIKTVMAEAGSIAYVDTKGIHRGKPLNEHVRYAIFCYFWHGEIPKHFAKLKQNSRLLSEV